MPEIVTIENDHWRIGLVPATGGSVAFGQARVGHAWVDVLRPTPEADLDKVSETASFPLVPWSNRINSATLEWNSKVYPLRVNFPDGTAIHGTSWEFPWKVVERESHRVVLEFASKSFHGVNWPWDFTARFEYVLDGARFTWNMSIINTSHETFPAGIGHHPYFQRQLAGTQGPVGKSAHLQANYTQTYPMVQCIPQGGAGPLPPHADYRELRPISTAFMDECYTGRTSPVACVIEWPEALRVTIEADDLLSHVVIYLPEGETFFACENVTNSNDAFHLDALGEEGTGLFLVQPSEARSASFTYVAQSLV